MFRPTASVLCAIAFPGLAPLGHAGSEAEIRARERDFNAGYAANVLDKYFAFHSDDATLWFRPQVV
jgi:hypothetical protein